MHPFLRKTFGGLSAPYYLRHFFFGLLLTALFGYVVWHEPNHDTSYLVRVAIWLGVSSLLYPYSRFVYESIVEFLLGDNFFVFNAGVMLFAKFVTMSICWGFAVVIAPIGLAYLYFHHTRSERKSSEVPTVR